MWAEPAGSVLTPPGRTCAAPSLPALVLLGSWLLAVAPLIWARASLSGAPAALGSPRRCGLSREGCPWPALPPDLVSRVLLGLSVSWQIA